jgi:hypothetical protein
LYPEISHKKYYTTPECFDPEKDYSKYPFDAIIIPVACRKYKKVLRGKIKNLEK